jgi:hypothetical protein
LDTVSFTNSSSVKSFTSTMDTASTIATLSIDGTWGGTVNVNNSLSVTSGMSLGSGTFGGTGAVTVAGNSTWSGGTLDVGTGGLTNSGTLTLSNTSSAVVLAGNGRLTNAGTIVQSGAGGLDIQSTVTNATTLLNQHGATYDLEADSGISSTSGGGKITNAGLLEKSVGTGTSTIGVRLNNTGTVEVNTGTLLVSGIVKQIHSNILRAGAWVVNGTASVPATLDISSGSFASIGAKAKVTLNGGAATFTNLSSVETNAGSFSLLGGQSFTVPNEFTQTYHNKGKLTIGPGSALNVGNFMDGLTATLTVQIGGTSSSPLVGQIVEQGSGSSKVSLNGRLVLQILNNVQPPLTTVFDIIVGNHAGAFSNEPEGSAITVGGETYVISYLGGDVTLTRTL